MRISIHQPHYFPWLGYFDKMAKADKFVLLDEVQLEKGSPMIRNRVLDPNGEVKYLTISVDTKDFLNRKYNALAVKDRERCFERQFNMLKNYYRTAKYRDEVLPLIQCFFSRDYTTVCQWTCGSIELVRELLEIETPLVYQSDLDYDRSQKRSDLVYAICNALGADTYLSGRGGSRDYLKREEFGNSGIQIMFQDFTHPSYQQLNNPAFVPGISVLDMLFNCGIEESRRIFWECVHSADCSPS